MNRKGGIDIYAAFIKILFSRLVYASAAYTLTCLRVLS